MFMPTIFGENLFDDFMNDFFRDEERDMRRLQKRLYGHHGRDLMKTDIKETDNGYELAMDLPGFTKDDIEISLDHGYLVINASKNLDQDEQNEDNGRYIRRERFSGACQRSFYVGNGVSESDIRAEFKHGILMLYIPKAENKIPEKKYIAIEG